MVWPAIQPEQAHAEHDWADHSVAYGMPWPNVAGSSVCMTPALAERLIPEWAAINVRWALREGQRTWIGRDSGGVEHGPAERRSSIKWRLARMGRGDPLSERQ